MSGAATPESGDGEGPAPPATDRSRFEVERAAVEVGLATAEELGQLDPDGFWSMMARASAAGHLDEAIFLHLLDESLVEEYVAYRADHAEALLTYLLTVVVELPEEPEG